MHRQQKEEAALSSSLKRLGLKRRSLSLPAVVKIQNPSIISATSTHDEFKHVTEDGSVKSWAKTLHSLAKSTISISPSKNNASKLHRKIVGTKSIPRSARRTPVLTMTLMKLHDVFETFCCHLTDATFLNVKAACMVLDSAANVASPKTYDPSSSPATIIDSPSSHKSSSPSRSPITSWFIGSYTSELGFSEESEWAKYCNPLIIFAGLEAIYSACSHINSHSRALTLMRLYERTVDDLRLVREVLCDPFANLTESESLPWPDPISSYKEKAASITLSIEAIMLLCEYRCKLIEQQTRLCSSENIDVEKTIASFQMIQDKLPTKAAKSATIVQSVLREVEGWCNIMKTYSSFGKHRFMDAVVGCQKIKLKLNPSPETCIQKWMCKIYKSFLSILPIYFESVSRGIVSQYGFQEPTFRVKRSDNGYGQNFDIEAKLENFLRNEGRSGTHLAVAVVADIAGLHMLRSKSNHGSFTIGKEMSSNTNRSIMDPDDILSTHPALYIRTTIAHDFSSKMLGHRRNSGKKDSDNDHMFENTPCEGVNSRTEINSWPYTSWDCIIPKLKNTILYRSKADPVETNWSQVDPDTLVYVSTIHNSMWLVAMKKTNHYGRWNRQNDEERIRRELQFFSDFSTYLRLRNVFKSNLEMNNYDTDSLLNELSNTIVGDRVLDNDHSNQLLESFKRIFGLRSPGNKNSIRFRNRKATISPEFYKGPTTRPSAYLSHYAFFLGSNLMDSLGD